MLSRKQQVSEGIEIPEHWTQNTKTALSVRFAGNPNIKNKEFSVYGKVYPDEILLIGSLVSNEDTHQGCSTVFVSSDIKEIPDAGSKAYRGLLNSLIDAMGYIFDDFLAQTGHQNYDIQWFQETIGKQEFFYRMSRENIALTLEADRLLKEGGKG